MGEDLSYVRLTNTFECIFIVSDRKPLSWRRHDVDIIFLTGHETQNTLGKRHSTLKHITCKIM